MTDLLDVNVWLALVDENHEHHAEAADYWQFQSNAQMAFCRVTSLGFLRLATHPKVLSRALTLDEAWAVYQRCREQSGVVFLEDSPEVDAAFKDFCGKTDWAHHLWTDAYLAALSLFRGSRLVSFDADFKRFKGLDFLQLSPA